MENSARTMTRRVGLLWGSQLLVGMAMAGKLDKQDFFYQTQPKDNKSCSTCRLYTATPSGKGVCALLDGEVSPSGWCMAYSPR